MSFQSDEANDELPRFMRVRLGIYAPITIVSLEFSLEWEAT